MKHSYAVLGILVALFGAAYLTSSIISSTVMDVASVSTSVVSVQTNVFKLSPSSLSLQVTASNAKFDNAVAVSFPYIPGTTWPAWYVTNTAPWNTIAYHYGKGAPNGYGPGTMKWTTDLTGYAPGTYTDTITLTSEKYGSVNLIQTVQVLQSDGTPSSNTNTPPSTQTTASGQYKLIPSSVSLQIPADNAPFDNAVGVSLPGFTSYPWPKWYITNTAPWNTIAYHYGKGAPNGYGPGTINWTTNLAGYKPGTYTDTITLSGSPLAPVTFTDTVTVLPSGVAPVNDSNNPMKIQVNLDVASTISGNEAFVTATIGGNTQNTNIDHYGLAITCQSGVIIHDKSNTKSLCGTTQTYYTRNMVNPTQDYIMLTSSVVNNSVTPSGNTTNITFSLVAYDSHGNNIGGDKNGLIVPPATAQTTSSPSTKFKVSDTVKTTANLNIHATASSKGSIVATESTGSMGTIAGGPTNADNLSWWQITFSNGVTGWGSEDYLVSYVAPPIVETPPDEVPPNTPPPALGTLPAHPRVWMSPSRLADMKTQVAANSSRWVNVKRSADSQVSQGIDTAAKSSSYLPVLCAAYLGTGDAKYASRAGDILTAYAVETNTIQGDSGYDYRSALPAVSIGLDWCYNGLTVAERHQAATWLMNRADQIWPETNPKTVGYGVKNVGDNYYWGFMMTGPAALAATGNDTGVGPVSGTDRATYHINLALSKWNATAVPFLTNEIEGGADLEGTGYDISGSIGKFVDAFQTANQGVTTPWLAQSIEWHMEYTMPGGAYFVPFGDQARVSNGPMYIYNRENMLVNLASANASNSLNSLVQSWLTLIKQVPSRSDDGNLTNEFIYYKPSAPSAADLGTLPHGYYSKGAGDVIYRSSFADPNATVMAFESGPLYESHQSLDANGLMIWKGSFWVSASANIYSHSGIAQETKLFNNLTIGGVGQNHNSGGGTIVGTPTLSDSLVVVRGQAANAYGTASGRPLTDYLRTVAYLPQQDTFVVTDHITAADPSQAKVIRWQSKDPAIINGNTFVISNPKGDARCYGSVLLPARVTLASEAVSPDSTRGNTEITSYAVTVTVPTGNATDNVVTTLQCTNGQSAPYNVSASISGSTVSATIGSTRLIIPVNDGTVTLASNDKPSFVANVISAAKEVVQSIFH